jgi:hypothetical protein
MSRQDANAFAASLAATLMVFCGCRPLNKRFSEPLAV